LDPQLINNPSDAPRRYRDLVQQRYLLTKYTNSSYNETGCFTPIEKQYLFEFIEQDLKKQQEAFSKINNKS
jgi:hypothetical protein